MNENQWKYIPDGPICVDLSGCKYACQIHNKLKESFGFPEYYGKNWSAFWDCLRDFASSEDVDRFVVVRGLDQISEDLKDYSQKMIEIMERAEKEYPVVHFVFENS